MTRRKHILILGGGSEIFPLLQALQPSPEFELRGWYGSAVARQLAELFPHASQLQGLDKAGINEDSVIIVGAHQGPYDHEAQLRDLARDGIPMVLMQPPCSSIFALELDMIQRDTGAPLIPIHAASLHPLLDWLADLTQATAGPLGELEQIVVERAAVDRSDQAVLTWLAQDALLFRRLLGDFERVGAMQGGEDKSLSNVSVHLSGRGDAIGRWSIGPVLDTAGGVLSVIGERGRISIGMPTEGAWTVSHAVDVGPPQPAFDEAAALRRHVEVGLRGEPSRLTWEDACRCMDLADVASESVRRGKTLAIRNERLTEEDTFKGMMAAGGCLIMLILPLILLLIGLVDGLDLAIMKQTTLQAVRGQPQAYLPADVRSLEGVLLVASGRPLKEILSLTALQETYPGGRVGTPQAFAVADGQLWWGPVPDTDYEVMVAYEGTFTIAKWWFLLLLVPMTIFLCLQLFKFVFPKPEAAHR